MAQTKAQQILDLQNEVKELKKQLQDKNEKKKTSTYKKLGTTNTIIIAIAISLIIAMVGIYIYTNVKSASEVQPLDREGWNEVLSIVDKTYWNPIDTKSKRLLKNYFPGLSDETIYLERSNDSLKVYFDNGNSFDISTFSLIDGIATSDYLSKDLTLYFSESNNKTGRALTLIIDGNHIVFSQI